MLGYKNRFLQTTIIVIHTKNFIKLSSCQIYIIKRFFSKNKTFKIKDNLHKKLDVAKTLFINQNNSTFKSSRVFIENQDNYVNLLLKKNEKFLFYIRVSWPSYISCTYNFQTNILDINGPCGLFKFVVPKIFDFISVKKQNDSLKGDDHIFKHGYFIYNQQSHLTKKNIISQLGTLKREFENQIIGVCKQIKKKLTLFGVGYKVHALEKENILSFELGFSHTLNCTLNPNITYEITRKNTRLYLKSTDLEGVSNIAATFHKLRRPDSYKGKGIRYYKEQIVWKEVKKKR